jgi:hypothetical protein
MLVAFGQNYITSKISEFTFCWIVLLLWMLVFTVFMLFTTGFIYIYFFSLQEWWTVPPAQVPTHRVLLTHKIHRAVCLLHHLCQLLRHHIHIRRFWSSPQTKLVRVLSISIVIQCGNIISEYATQVRLDHEAFTEWNQPVDMPLSTTLHSVTLWHSIILLLS